MTEASPPPSQKGEKQPRDAASKTTVGLPWPTQFMCNL
jgi:hypothetical protein